MEYEHLGKERYELGERVCVAGWGTYRGFVEWVSDCGSRMIVKLPGQKVWAGNGAGYRDYYPTERFCLERGPYEFRDGTKGQAWRVCCKSRGRDTVRRLLEVSGFEKGKAQE